MPVTLDDLPPAQQALVRELVAQFGTLTPNIARSALSAGRDRENGRNLTRLMATACAAIFMTQVADVLKMSGIDKTEALAAVRKMLRAIRNDEDIVITIDDRGAIH